MTDTDFQKRCLNQISKLCDTVKPKASLNTKSSISSVMEHTWDSIATLHGASMAEFNDSAEECENMRNLNGKIFWENIRRVAEVSLDAINNDGPVSSTQSYILKCKYPRAKFTNDPLTLQWAVASMESAEGAVDVNYFHELARLYPTAFASAASHISTLIDGPEKSSSPIYPSHVICASKKPCMNHVKAIFNVKPRMSSYKDSEGRTPLHIAAQHTESRVLIEYLLQLNPSAISSLDNSRSTPLALAARLNASPLTVIQCLLSVDPTQIITAIGNNGSTLMHLCAKSSIYRTKGTKTAILAYLHSISSSLVESRDKHNRLPLFYCRDDADAVRYLLDIHPTSTSDDATMLALTKSATIEVFHTVVDCLDVALGVTAVERVFKGLLKAVPDHARIEYVCVKYPACVRLSAAPLQKVFNNNHFEFETVKAITKVFPEAVSAMDENGQLPIHVLLAQFPVAQRELGMVPAEWYDILSYLLQRFPGAVSVKETKDKKRTPYDILSRLRSGAGAVDTSFSAAERMLLRVKPELDCKRFRELNYMSRRGALLLGFGCAIIPVGKSRHVISVLAYELPDLFREVLSYL